SIKKQLELDHSDGEMAQVLTELRALLLMRVREVTHMRQDTGPLSDHSKRTLRRDLRSGWCCK
ncbi:MAG: hypothetical protein QNK24_03105, partial [Desulfuromusa sp.]|nr:hypothetical protein [Desulfuromusa sp.]